MQHPVYRETSTNAQEGPIKELCYITLDSSIIWDPFTEANIWKLEMVQRRAARIVFSDYRRTSSVTTMLHHLQWPAFQERSARAKVTMMYRIVNCLVEVPTTSLTTTISARGHRLHDLAPFARTSSFFPDTICLWNSLPQSVVSYIQPSTASRGKYCRSLSDRLSWTFNVFLPALYILLLNHFEHIYRHFLHRDAPVRVYPGI